MRRKKSDVVREAVCYEIMLQTESIVEFIIQDEIRKSKLDLDTKYDVFLLNEIIGTDCFNVYLPYKNGIYQIAHYHCEDCMYIVTNQELIHKHIKNSIARIIKLNKQGYTPDERCITD